MSKMLPDRTMKSGMPNPGRATQRGFSIVTAIFLLMMLAALGALMVTFSTVQSTTSTQDLQGSRAYQAARAGIEWGVYQAVNGNCAATSTLPTLADDLAPFSVTVTCTGTSYTEGTTAGTIYQIVSTASSGIVGNTNYVERQLQATVGG